MAKDPELIHLGVVTEGGSLKYKHIEWWLQAIDSLRGKDVEITIKERKREKSIPQLALYFGVIIKKYCMPDEQFGGWTEHEIDQYLRSRATSYNKTFQTKKFTWNVEMVDDIRLYTVEQMKNYIDKVLAILAMDHGIYIEDPLLFKMNKYLKTED